MADFSERISTDLYGRVRRVLVPWLRMPEGVPDLPRGDRDALEVFQPAPGFLSYLKVWFWMILAIIDVSLLAVWIGITVAKPFLGVLLTPFMVALIFVPDVIAWIALHLRYENTWYAMTDRAVRIRRGVWVIRETTISFENVQNVGVRQGPIQRLFNISDVVIETAGSGGARQHHGSGMGVTNQGVIEGIEDAARIRDLILARIRRARGAGLGDDDEESRLSRRPSTARDPAQRDARRGGMSRQHVEVLREIRDLLCDEPA